ncbi:VOC family protein [Nonomuraea sp. NN258]|uniref:VOC family protein n=1 Tax=Nonomuraea antri TaxID=2730852 RepID=UPI00156A5BBD|nr:VOC family protein [Nonomuraea antri]NRQ34123.1 VOC family protein [Nonomuraea antri]
MTDPRVDHLVYAVPDLRQGVADFAARTGVSPVLGGCHPGGTANYLVGLGPSAYLEIIGPDPDNPDVEPPALDLDRPRLVTWAIRPDDLDKCVERARELGYDPGDVQPLSRRTPDGTLLEWRLTGWDDPAVVRPVPFLIDWGAAAHPAASGLPQLELLSLAAVDPDPEAVTRRLAAVSAELEVSSGAETGLRAVLGTPRGPVTLD